MQRTGLEALVDLLPHDVKLLIVARTVDAGDRRLLLWGCQQPRLLREHV